MGNRPDRALQSAEREHNSMLQIHSSSYQASHLVSHYGFDDVLRCSL